MIRWQPNRVRPFTQKGIRRAAILGLATAGLVSTGLATITHFRPCLIYNASASVPLGYYRVLPIGMLKVSDLVLLHTPETVVELADQRRYLPKSVPMIKHIAALKNDEVCAIDDRVFVNGQLKARRQERDHLNRPLPRWQGCRTLADDELFVLNPDALDSFDGRYFGVVKTSLVIGRLAPL